MSLSKVNYVKFYDFDLFEPDCLETVKEYLCPLCTGILYDAVVDICGHVFCRSCINSWLKSLQRTKICPLEKSIYNCDEDQIIHPLPLIKVIIDKQRLKCKNKCDWKGTASDLIGHLENDCLNTAIKCSNEGCSEVFMRTGKKDHEALCEYRMIDCEDCRSPIPVKNTIDHMRVCPNFKVDCPLECGYIMERKDVKLHEETTCLNSYIPCVYSKLGCDVQFMRKNVLEHNSAYQKKHEELIINTLVAIKERLDMGTTIIKRKRGRRRGQKNTKKKIEKDNSSLSEYISTRRIRRNTTRKGVTDFYYENGRQIDDAIHEETTPLTIDRLHISCGLDVIDNRVIMTARSKNEHKFVFANVRLNDIEYSWKVIVTKKGKWMALGVCIKEKVVSNEYKFTPHALGFEHGCFLVSSNGYMWNHNIEGENNVFASIDENSLPIIDENLEVNFKYSAVKRTLQVKLKSYTINLTNVSCEPEMTLVPCTILFSTGDDITIIK